MPRLNGKHVLVTGAAQGIGRACVERFVAEGAEVHALDINARALSDLGANCGCVSYVIDVTDAVAVARFAQEANDIDILVLCAGYVATGTILDCKEADWHRSFDLNVTAMYRLIRLILPGMVARGKGSIITMSSVASAIRGVPDRFAYAATKGAVIGLTKAIAADFAGHGIRCNAICPGTVETPSLIERMNRGGEYQEMREKYTARQPMGRLGSAEEIAGLALYLASDEAAFVTGQCHVIDGGWAN